MLVRVPLLFLCVFCAALFAACGGGGGAGPVATPGPSNGFGLVAADTAEAAIVYPAPTVEPTAASSGPATVTFTLTLPGLGSSTDVIIAERGLSAPYSVSVAPTPAAVGTFAVNANPTALPSSLAGLPSGAAPTYLSVTGPMLKPATTYTFTLTGCSVPGNGVTCASPGSVSAGTYQTDCGPPPPTAAPFVVLDSPAPNATGVSTAIGTIVMHGSIQGARGPGTLALTSAAGVAVPLGSPSPVPGSAGFSVTVPTLAPATTYALALNYVDYANVLPSCVAPGTQRIATFTTQ